MDRVLLQREVKSSSPPVPPGVILVVEDDPDTCDNVRDILELDGYEVHTAGTAAEALAFPTDGCAAMILDRRLPDATAEELLPKLRALHPRAPIVVMTGYSDLNTALAILREGASDYLLKPINPEALLASLSRIVERRWLEEEKTRAEEQVSLLAAAIRQVSDGVLITTADAATRDYRIVYANAGVLEMTGFNTDELLGKSPRILHGPQTDVRVLQRLRVALEEGRPFTAELVHYRKDGAPFDAAITISPVFNARHELTHFISIHRDVTDRKRQQEHQLQTERLAAIGQMVTGLAHESRNALQRSQACVELLAKRVRDQPEARDLLARIQLAQDHLHQLYEEVRSYAAPIRLDRRRQFVADIWREAWQHLSRLRAGRDTQLHEHLNEVDLWESVDAFKLEQVFRNVFENSLAACRDPVVVEVSAAVTTFQDGPALQIRIRDNGPGLNAEQAVRIFEPFFTTKTRGTGLGMAIARRNIEAHGGAIAVGPNSPGAELILTIPREET
ncbi:MAG TPA: response regulator [Planctomycetaceae bacterium]|nr:response regulator [Planctomycetaceae bacterium]